MNICTQNTKLKELITIDKQIDKTISDIGRLSSYNQSTTDLLSKIKSDKISHLHSLIEKKEILIQS